MKDYTFTANPEQRQLLGAETFKCDIFGSIIGKGTQSPFHWMVEFDGIGALEVDDKKLSKHPTSQKKPRFPKQITSPPPPSEEGVPTISFEPLNIRTTTNANSLQPSDQDHIEGYEVDSVKFTSDPKQQQTMSQIYGDPSKQRPIIRTGLLEFAKNWSLYKQVKYVPKKKSNASEEKTPTTTKSHQPFSHRLLLHLQNYHKSPHRQ